MTSTARNWLIATVAVILVGLFLTLLPVIFPVNDAGAAELPRRQVTSVERHGAYTITTWTTTNPSDPAARTPGMRAVCLDRPAEILAGWTIRHNSNSTGPVAWTFGPWSGSSCTTNQHIVSMNWGQPAASANPLMNWRYDGKTRTNFDNAGDLRSARWEGKFSSLAGPTFRAFPWLRVSVRPGGASGINTYHGCDGHC